MFDEDDLSDVESDQKWYEEYHPGGILVIIGPRDLTAWQAPKGPVINS